MMMKMQVIMKAKKNYSDERNEYSGNLLLDIDVFFFLSENP